MTPFYVFLPEIEIPHAEPSVFAFRFGKGIHLKIVYADVKVREAQGSSSGKTNCTRK